MSKEMEEIIYMIKKNKVKKDRIMGIKNLQKDKNFFMDNRMME